MDALTLSQPGDVLRAASSSLPPVASSSSAGQATSGGSSSIQSPMQGASSSTGSTVPASSSSSSSGLVGSSGGASSYSPLNLVQSVPPPPPASSSSASVSAASSSSSSSTSPSAVGLIYSSFNPMQSGIRMLDLTSPSQAASSDSTTGTNVAASASTLNDASGATGAMHPIKRIKTSNLTTSFTLVTSGSSSGSSSSSSNANCSALVSEKLERRLNGILCCAVCMDLPHSSVFQCTNGHLMCSACFTHLLADARLRDETATCPSCRCIITRDVCSRNLAVEKAVSELPGSCRFCERELPRAMLHIHENDGCEERLVTCRFSRIGCPWRGPFHELGAHECNCSHPNKSGREILAALEKLDSVAKEEQKLYDCIFDLLSFEKITFNDLQFRGYRTEEFIQRLYYETSRFQAFNNQWVVKARVNNNEKDPSQVCERKLTYQLVLKNKPSSPISVQFLILKGPFGDMKVHPRLYRFDFNESNLESPYNPLSLYDSAECNKLLAFKAINFRLIMFQMPK